MFGFNLRVCSTIAPPVAAQAREQEPSIERFWLLARYLSRVSHCLFLIPTKMDSGYRKCAVFRRIEDF